jgi:hypothetical protein
MSITSRFCRLLRKRSEEHLSAGKVLIESELFGQVVSVLRQEVDSMVRAIFLLNQDLNDRQHYMDQTLHDTKCTMPNSKSIITDRQMVELSNHLHGWTKSVYKFGCAFIHLSSMSDYKNENPFSKLSEKEEADIKQHLFDYHSFPLSNKLNIDTVSPYLFRILKKIHDNLETYIKSLEKERFGAD